MATDLSGTTFSETDASNNSASPNGAPEGMAPSGVNDTMRMMMGASKRAYDRDHGGTWATVGGTGDAITLAYTTGPTAYVQGEKFNFKATAANTTATTVNVSALGVKNVFKKTTAGPAACAGGEIQIGDLVEIEYDGTQFQIISGTAGGVASIADATAGGLSFSASTGAVTAKLLPSDLTTKAAPVKADIVMIGDSASGSSAARSTLAQLMSVIPPNRAYNENVTASAITGVIPYDDTIPQSSEGTAIHSLAITPTKAGNVIRARVLVWGERDAGATQVTLSMFQSGSSASAIAAAATENGSANFPITAALETEFTTINTTPITFTVNLGVNAGTFFLNGVTGPTRRFGGVGKSTFVLEEISS